MWTKIRAWVAWRVLLIAARAEVWGYVQLGKSKGWNPDQIKVARRIAQQEQNQIWDSVRGVVLWNKAEQDIVNQRLARRFDPGMTLNEVANRAIAARAAVKSESAESLTPQQLAALKFQKEYLDRVVRRS